MRRGLLSVLWLQAELTQPSVQGLRALGQRRQEFRNRARSASQAREVSSHQLGLVSHQEKTAAAPVSLAFIHTHTGELLGPLPTGKAAC